MTEPIIKFESGGQASILNYNVPEPTSYTGRNIISLDMDNSIFLQGKTTTEEPKREPVLEDPFKISEAVKDALKTGYFEPKYFPNITIPPSPFLSKDSAITIKSLLKDEEVLSTATEKIKVEAVKAPAPSLRETLTNLVPQMITEHMKKGEQLGIYKNLYGHMILNL